MKKKPPLGQHFLIDQQVCAELIAAINPQQDELIVEIGPGKGVLTKFLLQAGAQVIAVEKDRKLAQQLEQRMGNRLASRLDVICADAVRQFQFPKHGDWRLVGNLPYEISSPLLFAMSKNRRQLIDSVVMVQKEFAVRLCAQPVGRDYGRLSVAIQARFAVELLFEVSADAFAPSPQVESAVVKLVPHRKVPTVVDSDAFENIIRVAFSRRRKMLGNALSSINCELDAQLAGLRPENVSVDDYIRLANQLNRSQQ